jgi:carbon catabolite-derepressing protein kinase
MPHSQTCKISIKNHVGIRKADHTRLKVATNQISTFDSAQKMSLRYTNIESYKSGTYGKVYGARNAYTGQPVALKKQKLENKEEGVPGWILRELDILNRIHHPNILKITEVFWKNTKSVWISMPRCQINLWSYGTKNKWSTRSKILKPLVVGLTSAIAALHDLNITHYDIKPENILLDSEQGIYLIDFGLCNPASIDDTNDICTLNYRPPELLCVDKSKSRYDGKSADVWY